MPDDPHSYIRGDAAGHGRVIALDTAAARREWNRLAGTPAPARAALVARTVWNREYPTAYRASYTAAAGRIAAAATDAAAGNPRAWLTLHQLAASAGASISRLATEHVAAPPADDRTVAAAHAAASALGQRPPWQRIADVAASGGRTAGALAGTLTATADILVGWRDRGGHFEAAGVTADGRPARTWVAHLLATVNRDTATRVAAASTPVRTAAQLAREDRAHGVSSRTVDTCSGRAQRAAPLAAAPITTRRTR